LTFWVVRIDNLEQIIGQALEAGRFPIDIYPGWLRGGLTYVIPVVFILSVPAQALAGRSSTPQIIQSVIVAIGSLLFSAFFWRYGLKNYTGASS
jgi:ABC-2 type transport system permease protein